ncbi:DUF7573 domain-containing protein [Halobacterium hubeiense]|uniref:DUF7573 domain-containing protein n=1 Tax=Halobacterium hubeiense TaxID=1407499 RepID=UPI003C716325
MSEDATLDAFAREGGDADAVDAAPVTSSWREAGVCEACGEAADRRWLDDGERVCAACKRWS